MNKDLSIIIPAYKEAENLKVILPKLNTTLKALTSSYEILVIDTIQAMDITQEVCRENNTTYLNRIGGGNYYGDAVRTGIQNASGTYTIFMDADGSHTPEFITKLYNERERYDVVIASRYVEGGETDNSNKLKMMSIALNLIYSVVLNLQCKDVSNSFKLYKTKDLQVLELACNNFDIVEEILFRLKKNKRALQIKEIPFSFKKRMFGTTKRNLFTFIVTYFFTLIKLRLS